LPCVIHDLERRELHGLVFFRAVALDAGAVWAGALAEALRPAITGASARPGHGECRAVVNVSQMEKLSRSKIARPPGVIAAAAISPGDALPSDARASFRFRAQRASIFTFAM
jgi:hypothetical protein